MAESPDSISIRPICEGDAEAVWRISQQRGVMETILALPSDRMEERASMLRNLGPDRHWFVAQVDDRVVGIAGLDVGRGRTRHSGHLFVYVDRAYHGRGVGTRLIETVLDLADNWLLLRRVELTVIAGNDGAKRLYERLGFEMEGVRKLSVIADGEIKDEYMMARYR